MGGVNETPSNAQVLSSIVAEVTPQLFEAYGTSVEHISATLQPDPSVAPELAGVLGFVGDDLHGTVTLATSTAVMQGMMKDVPGADLLTDWLAELTNQLLGRIKNRLLRCGTSVMSSTPVVVTGQQLKVAMGEHSVNCCHTFRTGVGALHVWLGAEIAEGVEIREKGSIEPAPGEGDLLLF